MMKINVIKAYLDFLKFDSIPEDLQNIFEIVKNCIREYDNERRKELVQQISYDEFIKLGYKAKEDSQCFYFDNGVVLNTEDKWKKGFQNSRYNVTQLVGYEQIDIEFTDRDGRKSIVKGHPVLGYSFLDLENLPPIRTIDPYPLWIELDNTGKVVGSYNSNTNKYTGTYKMEAQYDFHTLQIIKEVLNLTDDEFLRMF